MLAITLLPYSLIANNLQTSLTTLTGFALIISQLVSSIFIINAFKQTKSKSLKLFWQYLLLALVGGLITTLGNLALTKMTLLNDFMSLFSYFFILLAIETNPHLNKMPTNKYIGGRVPAIFFCVVSFGYYILLPYQFAEANYKSLQPSALFHIVITGLITLRLIINTVRSKSKFWQKLYGYLLIGALAILIENLLLFNQLSDSSSRHAYLQSLLLLLPYLALTFSAQTSIKGKASPKSEHYQVYSELYILLLAFGSLLSHFIGVEFKLVYVVGNLWQSTLLVIWLCIAITFIALITNKKRKLHSLLKSNFNQLTAEHKTLEQQNDALNQALINSENKAIVYASSNAILTTSIDGNILSANPAAVQIFQILEQDLIGTNVNKLFSSEDKMYYFFDFKSNVYALQRKDEGMSIECTAIRSDHSKFPVQVELQWADRQETPLIVITFINLTARKLAEKQALELKDKFIANISHEFRTPLTIINGILDRYLKKATSLDESQELTTAKRNGLRLVRMVEQLLELSRLSDNPQLSLSTYRLKTLMNMPCDSFFRLASQSQLDFNVSIPDDLWIECDAQAFEKIIFNLLTNAIKYTPAGGSITVNAYQENDTVIVDVIDTGIGIDKQSQSKIFERFQRAEDEKNHAIFGVGIGLSLVNELVKAHQWRINLVSEYNQGSKFSLSIPAAQAIKLEESLPLSMSEDELSSLLMEQNTPQLTSSTHSHQVVLVIEDNLDMQSHIKQVIEQAHHCLLASSGELGLTLAQEYLPDLIVCDIMLTGIDGFEVLKQLKENELTSHIPIILLTARSDLDSRLQGLNLHADDYLSKPFNQQELLVRIANLIDNRKQLQQNYLKQFQASQTLERKNASHDKASLLTTGSEAPSLDEKFLAKLEAVIAKKYTEPEIGIADLANDMAMSERQLQRKIKVLLGTTPNNFIKEFRLKKAQELLKSGAQIGRIALDVGFSSQTYFGRCFKETFDCTPKQYQQRYLEQ